MNEKEMNGNDRSGAGQPTTWERTRLAPEWLFMDLLQITSLWLLVGQSLAA
jgi:hypothetical protein